MKKYILAALIFLLFAGKTFAASEYTVEPSLSLSEEYNDNIFSTRSGRVSDFISYISPGIALSTRSINSELRLGYSTSFSFYRSHEELNEPAHRFTAHGSFTLSERLILTLTDNFIKSSETRDIREIPDIGPVRRAEWTVHTITGNASYRLTTNLFYTLGLSYSDADTNASDLIKAKTYSGSMGLTYRTSERTTLSANASYIKYDKRPANDATGQNYLLGVTHNLSPTVTISASGGLSITKIQSEGGSSIDFGGGVDLTKTFEAGIVNLSYRHRVISSVESESPLRAQTVSFSLSKPVTNKLASLLSASYSNYKSIKTAGVNTDEVSFNAGLTYSFIPEASLSLSYNYVNSNNKINNDRDFRNNIVLLTLRLSYNKKL